MWTLLLVKLIILAPLPIIFFCNPGIGDPFPWSVLLVEGLVGLCLRYGCSSATVLHILRGRAGSLGIVRIGPSSRSLHS